MSPLIDQSPDPPADPEMWQSQTSTHQVMLESNNSHTPIYEDNNDDVIIYVIVVIITPIVAAVGISGNFLSILLLVQHGLDKSFHVMLVALACSDTSFLLGEFLYGVTAHSSLPYLNQRGSFIFIFYKILLVLDYGGAWVSFMMPLVITVERVLVVSFPLKVSHLLSARRTFCAVCVLYIVMYGLIIYLTIDTLDAHFINSTSPPNDGTINLNRNFTGVKTEMDITDFLRFKNIFHHMPVFNSLSIFFFGPIPVGIVLLGCIFLVRKMKVIELKRQTLTNGSNNNNNGSSASRITLTIAILCSMYLACSITVFTIQSNTVKDFFSASGEQVQGHTREVILQEVCNMCVLTNCSLNFVIYVVLNPAYRKTFWEMLLRGRSCLRRHLFGKSGLAIPA